MKQGTARSTRTWTATKHRSTPCTSATPTAAPLRFGEHVQVTGIVLDLPLRLDAPQPSGPSTARLLRR